ncbi:MAG: hypothetical protein KBD78_14100 [Oligoflexales bacterium]|nr:hypothetical protein [Oligoflexales bacterium]
MQKFQIILLWCSMSYLASCKSAQRQLSKSSTFETCRVNEIHNANYVGAPRILGKLGTPIDSFQYLYQLPCSSISTSESPQQTTKTPIYIYLTGTFGDWQTNWIKQYLLSYMSARGFIAVTAEYSFDYLVNCSRLEEKSNSIFDHQLSTSLISDLAHRLQHEHNIIVDLNNIVVHGHSQGSFIANIAAQKFTNIKAALLTGTGTRFGVSAVFESAGQNYNLECLEQTDSQSNSKILAISGEDDDYYFETQRCEKSKNAIQLNLERVTGIKFPKDCTAIATDYECLQLEGSGWLIVNRNELGRNTKIADHRYFMNDLVSACPWRPADRSAEPEPDPNWLSPDPKIKWSRDSTLNWLINNSN